MNIVFITNAYTRTAVPYIKKLLDVRSKDICGVILLDPVSFSRILRKIGKLGLGHVLKRAAERIRSALSAGIRRKRKENEIFESVEELQSVYGFRVCKVKSLRSEAAMRRLKNMSPDLIFVCTLSEIVSPEILALPPLGVINIHAGLLPQYRGPASNFWVLYNRERKTGVTFHYMSDKPDRGDIIAQRELEIEITDTEESLDRKLSLLGAEEICPLAQKIENGTIERKIQDEDLATYFPQPEYDKRLELKKRLLEKNG